MSYTPLDPKKIVILFADLQAGILELAATNEPARLRRGVGALAKLARLFDIPVIVTTAPADGGARVTPEIACSTWRATTAYPNHDGCLHACADTGGDPSNRSQDAACRGCRDRNHRPAFVALRGRTRTRRTSCD